MKKNKLVVISGGTKGLGKALSLQFGTKGFYVIALYLKDKQSADQLKNTFNKRSISGEVIKKDISKGPINLKKSKDFSEIVLINNASSGFEPGPFHQYKWKDFENLIISNIKGSYNLTSSLIKNMVKCDNAIIINILSTALSQQVPKGFSAYVTAKYALLGFTRALASEYAHRNIKCFAVSPGFMKTDLTKNWHSSFLSKNNKNKRTLSPAQAAKKTFSLYLKNNKIPNGENCIL